MNNINQSFSFSRFLLLFKREMILRKSFVLTTLVGVALAMLGVILVVLATDYNFKHWSQEQYSVLFLVLFTVFGILFTGTAFPAFRNQKKTMDFLLIPNSSLEKYVFEVMFRIVGFIVLFPIIFWITANLAGAMISGVTTEHCDLAYKFWSPINEIADEVGVKQGIASILALVLFLMSVPFSGAAAFSKNPLFKTAITIAVFIGSCLFYGWLLDQIIGFTDVHGLGDPEISAEVALNMLTGFILFSTVVLHASSYMRLKEKEV